MIIIQSTEKIIPYKRKKTFKNDSFFVIIFISADPIFFNKVLDLHLQRIFFLCLKMQILHFKRI